MVAGGVACNVGLLGYPAGGMRLGERDGHGPYTVERTLVLLPEGNAGFIAHISDYALRRNNATETVNYRIVLFAD